MYAELLMGFCRLGSVGLAVDGINVCWAVDGINVCWAVDGIL